MQGNTQPRSQGLFIAPRQRERGKKDPGSGWSRVLVTSLSSRERFQFFKILLAFVFLTSKTKCVSLRATLESSVSISQLSFIISNTVSSTFETGSGNRKKIKMSNNDV